MNDSIQRGSFWHGTSGVSGIIEIGLNVVLVASFSLSNEIKISNIKIHDSNV